MDPDDRDPSANDFDRRPPADPSTRPAAEQVQTRAALLPEEAAVGSDDPLAQAEVILEDSAERTEDRESAPTTFLEHRRSEDTV
jgi:hypothetical protein